MSHSAPDAGWLAGLPGAAFFRADLAQDDQCQAAVAAVRQHCGRIDGLANNARVNDFVGPDAFRASLDRNLVLALGRDYVGFALAQGRIVEVEGFERAPRRRACFSKV